MVVGGANKSVFFSANETTNVIDNSPVFTLIKKIKTSVTRTSFTIDQNEDSEALTTFLETYAPKNQATADTGEYENGEKFNSGTSASQTLLQIIYGGVDVSSPGVKKRKVTLMLCKMAQDAGAFDQESGKYTKPKVSGDVVNPDDDMVVSSTYFDTTLVSGATNVTIPRLYGYKEVWFTNNGPI
jgi:hypothetical protein